MNSYNCLQILAIQKKNLQILANSLHIDVQVAFSRILANSYKFLQLLTICCDFFYNFVQILANSLHIDIQVAFLGVLANS